MARFQVKRRSGRSGDAYRTILDTDDAAKARKRFAYTAERLCQGAVQLIVDGREAAKVSGPSLRSK